MFIENHILFGVAVLTFVIGYGLGQSSGRKGIVFRISKALDQHDVDVKAGYKEGYSGLGIVRIIRDIL